MSGRKAEVFSGGACKGFYYTGWLRAEEDLGLPKPSDIWGVSVGSIYAAVLSDGTSSGDVLDYLKGNNARLKKIFRPINILRPKNGLSRDDKGYRVNNDGRTLPKTGLCDTGPVEGIIEGLVGSVRFRERPGLNIVCADMETYEPLVLNSETVPDMKVSEGVLASASVPPLFPVRKITYKGRTAYVLDGGIAASFPMDMALQDGTDEVIGINLIGSPGKGSIHDNWLQNWVDTWLKKGSYDMRKIFNRGFGFDYETVVNNGGFAVEVDGSSKPVMIVEPDIDDHLTLNTSMENMEHLYEKGRAEGTEKLLCFEDYKANRFKH
jgi:predicted acylesterase/phospholipase RssA